MATIPTCLYYLSLLFMVELDAKRFGAGVVPYDTSLSLGQMMRRYGFHFTSLIAVIVFMIIGYSPMLAVFYSTLLCFLFSAMTPETSFGPRQLLMPLLIVAVAGMAIVAVRFLGTFLPIGFASLLAPVVFVADAFENYFPGFVFYLLAGLGILALILSTRERPEPSPAVASLTATSKRLVRALADGSIGVLNAATTCASAGIIVGVVTLTGLGLKFSSIVLDYAGGSLLLTALYTALIVWIVGLAVPVTASYIICAVIAAPALTKLGVPDFAAHMFIFYYAVLSEVSPPTALPPWKYTLPAFLVPFAFVLAPAGVGLLLKGSVANVIHVTGTAILGIAALACGVQGWMFQRTAWLERSMLIAGGILLLYPARIGDVAGVALAGTAAGIQYWKIKRRQHAATGARERTQNRSGMI